MVPASFFEGLLDAPSLEEVSHSLADTLFGDRFGGPEGLREADRTARDAYRGLMKEMQDISPDATVAELLLVQEQLRSLKNFVKRTRLDMPVSAPPSRYGEEVWERLWAGLDAELPEPFPAVVRRTRDALGSVPAHPGAFDAAFDGACLRALCDLARRTGSGFIAEYCRRYDTAKGVEFLWRGRALGLHQDVQRLLVEDRAEPELFAALRQSDLGRWPVLLGSALEGLDAGGLGAAQGPGRIRQFVRAADAWLMDFARAAKHVAFGPERVFGCLVGLAAEAHNLGLAAAGRANGIAPAILRPTLMACYV